MRTVQSMLKKCKQSGADCQLALLHWRTTPVCANLESPAQMLMGRRLKSTIPSRIQNDAPWQDDIRDTLYTNDKAHRSTTSTNMPKTRIFLFCIQVSECTCKTKRQECGNLGAVLLTVGCDVTPSTLLDRACAVRVFLRKLSLISFLPC